MADLPRHRELPERTPWATCTPLQHLQQYRLFCGIVATVACAMSVPVSARYATAEFAAEASTRHDTGTMYPLAPRAPRLAVSSWLQRAACTPCVFFI